MTSLLSNKDSLDIFIYYFSFLFLVCTQCGNLRILVPFRFYVKSIELLKFSHIDIQGPLLNLQNQLKMISRKICLAEKLLNFLTVLQKTFFIYRQNQQTNNKPKTLILFPSFLGIFRKLPDFASWTCLANFEISKIAQSGQAAQIVPIGSLRQPMGGSLRKCDNQSAYSKRW